MFKKVLFIAFLSASLLSATPIAQAEDPDPSTDSTVAGLGEACVYLPLSIHDVLLTSYRRVYLGDGKLLLSGLLPGLPLHALSQLCPNRHPVSSSESHPESLDVLKGTILGSNKYLKCCYLYPDAG